MMLLLFLLPQARASLFALEQRWLKTFVPSSERLAGSSNVGSSAIVASPPSTSANPSTSSSKSLMRLVPAPPAVVRDGGVACRRNDVAPGHAQMWAMAAKQPFARDASAQEKRRGGGANAAELLAPGIDSVNGQHEVLPAGGSPAIYHRAAVPPPSGHPVATVTAYRGDQSRAWEDGVAGQVRGEQCIRGREDRRAVDVRVGAAGGGQGKSQQQPQACHGLGTSGKGAHMKTPPPPSPSHRGHPQSWSNGGGRRVGHDDGRESSRVDLEPQAGLHVPLQGHSREQGWEYVHGRDHYGRTSGGSPPAERGSWRQHQAEQRGGSGSGDVRREGETATEPLYPVYTKGRTRYDNDTAAASAAPASVSKGGCNDGCGIGDGCGPRPGNSSPVSVPAGGDRAQPQPRRPRSPCTISRRDEPQHAASYSGPSGGRHEEHSHVRRHGDLRRVRDTMAVGGARETARVRGSEYGPGDGQGASYPAQQPAQQVGKQGSPAWHAEDRSRSRSHVIANEGDHSTGCGGGTRDKATHTEESGRRDTSSNRSVEQRRAGPFRLKPPAPLPAHLRMDSYNDAFFPGDRHDVEMSAHRRSPEQPFQAAAAAASVPQPRQQPGDAQGRAAAVKSERREGVMKEQWGVEDPARQQRPAKARRLVGASSQPGDEHGRGGGDCPVDRRYCDDYDRHLGAQRQRHEWSQGGGGGGGWGRSPKESGDPPAEASRRPQQMPYCEAEGSSPNRATGDPTPDVVVAAYDRQPGPPSAHPVDKWGDAGGGGAIFVPTGGRRIVVPPGGHVVLRVEGLHGHGGVGCATSSAQR